MQNNYVYIRIPSLSTNESFARAAVAAFCSSLNPTIEEISDIKTAVSEAVTNAIIHAYENTVGEIELQCRIKENMVEIIIEDFGCGIADVVSPRRRRRARRAGRATPPGSGGGSSRSRRATAAPTRDPP
jgi:anti-sigma F factor